MRIKDLEIHNLKGVVDFELHNAPEIVVLAGPNGVGKSTVLEAIASFYYATTYGWRIQNPVTVGEERAEIFIRFSLHDAERRYLRETMEVEAPPHELEGRLVIDRSGSLVQQYGSPLSNLVQVFDRNQYPEIGFLDYNDAHRLFRAKSVQ